MVYTWIRISMRVMTFRVSARLVTSQQLTVLRFNQPFGNSYLLLYGIARVHYSTHVSRLDNRTNAEKTNTETKRKTRQTTTRVSFKARRRVTPLTHRQDLTNPKLVRRQSARAHTARTWSGRSRSHPSHGPMRWVTVIERHTAHRARGTHTSTLYSCPLAISMDLLPPSWRRAGAPLSRGGSES